VPSDHALECGPRSVGRWWKQILSEVPRPQAETEIDEASQHKRPCCLKMKVSTPAILVGQHIAVPSRNGRSRRRDGYLEQGRSQRIAHFTPIETWVGDEDLNSGDQQGNKRNYRDPVRDSNECSMARSLIAKGNRRRAL